MKNDNDIEEWKMLTIMKNENNNENDNEEWEW